MRKKFKDSYLDDSIVEPECFCEPFVVQPPTFSSIAAAYSYFTRHPDDFPAPDYEEDSPEPPDFSTSDWQDFIFNSPSQQNITQATGHVQPAGSDDDGQHAANEPTEAPAEGGEAGE